MRKKVFTKETRIFILNEPGSPRIYPQLAKEIGLDESLLLLQLEFWLITYPGKSCDGKKWIFKSVRDIRETFCFWGVATIQRTIQSLEDQQLIETRQDLNEREGDTTRWFTLNPAALSRLQSISLRETCSESEQGCSDSEQTPFHIGTGVFQNGTTIPETSTETSTENNTEDKSSVLPLRSENGHLAASPSWPEEGLFVKDFLEQEPYLRPHYNEPILATLLNCPQWWESVAESVNGLSTERLNREFAKMGAWMTENPRRKPTPKGLKTFIRSWLERAYERERKQPWLIEKKADRPMR